VADLATTYLGLPLRNPVVVGSCGFTASVNRIRKCADAGAGAVVLKSIFEEQIDQEVDSLMARSGDVSWHPEAAEYISSYGREGAVATYLDLLREARATVSIPVIASINCVTAGGWVEFARRLEEAGAHALELNVLVLPSDPRRDGPACEKVYLDVATRVTKLVSIPVSLKICFYFSGLAQMIRRLGQTGIAGLVLFNRPYPIDLDIEKMSVIPGAWMSSPEEISLPLRWMAILHGQSRCDLAAATGVHDGVGVVKQILAGARAVQVCSTLYRNGVEQIGAILQEVEAWMTRHKVESLAGVQGRLSRALSDNPAAYERVQFMQRTLSQEE
jgi:dihydroorotate dehydrogenase (fumarate)